MLWLGTEAFKITTAFRAYANARANRANAAKSFIVKSLNKDGSISRMAPTKLSWQLDAFATAEEAEARRAEPRATCPGKRRGRALAQRRRRSRGV